MMNRSTSKAQVRTAIALTHTNAPAALPETLSEYLTDRSGAAMLAISRATWWRRVQDGTLPKSVKIGGATRWRRADVLAAIARLSSAAV